MTVYAELEGAFADLALLVLNVVLSLVHVNCQMLEIPGQSTYRPNSSFAKAVSSRATLLSSALRESAAV